MLDTYHNHSSCSSDIECPSFSWIAKCVISISLILVTLLFLLWAQERSARRRLENLVRQPFDTQTPNSLRDHDLNDCNFSNEFHRNGRITTDDFNLVRYDIQRRIFNQLN